MNRTGILIAALLVGSAACFGPDVTITPIQTEAVRARDLNITADATGVIEPVEIVDIKSKASGQVTEVAVESGSEVKKGDVLVRIDPREVEQRYQQALASRDAAVARRDVSFANRAMNRQLYAEKVISEQEFRQGMSDSASAATSLMSAEAALSIAQQQREDVVIRASLDGTITEKLVATGAVIQSSTSGNSAGTNLLRMADLTKVRIRASFNETDIANIRVGLPVEVKVDAFADKVFVGELTKIEPIAQVQQSVTMFPVQIAIDNSDRQLKPGMNAEVSVTVAEVYDVLAVPSDALRTLREAEYTATLLKLNPDTVRKQVNAQEAAMTGMGADAGPGALGPTVAQTVRGEIDFTAVAFQERPTQGRGRGGRAGGGRGGNQFAPPSAQECAPIKAAYDKNPAAKAKIDSLRGVQRTQRSSRDGGAGGTQGRSGEARGEQTPGQRTPNPITAEINAIYASLAVDATMANRCAVQLSGGGRGNPMPNAGGAGGGNAQSAAAPGGTGTQRQFGGARAGGDNRRPNNMSTQLRLVYVADSGKDGRTYTPRVIRPGLARFDYTEILDGLQEGERVVLMSSAVLAQQQEQNRVNAQNRAGGPLGQPGAGGPGRNPGGGPGGPGGGGGGGRGGRGGGGGGGGGGGRGGN